MNNNCKKNFQTEKCVLSMFNPTKIFTPCTNVSNWFQSATNIIIESNKYSQSRSRHLGMSFNFYKTPHKDYNFETHSTKINVDSSHDSILNAGTLNNTFCNLNSYHYGTGHTLEPNFNKKNKSHCDENIKDRYYKCNYKKKYPEIKIKQNKNKNEYKHLFNMSAKHKLSLAENSEVYLPKSKDLRHTKNCCDNLKRGNKSYIKNHGSAEIVAIFTLEDFPELPVPKQNNPWSFQFSQPCNSKNSFVNKKKSSTKIKSKSNNTHVQKSKNSVELKDTGKDNLVGDNFFIIMDKNSAQSNKLNPKNTGGSTQIKPRRRQISECSDDSFIICFTNDAADGVIEFTELSSNNSSCPDSDNDSDYFEEFQLEKNSRSNSSIKKTENINTASQPDSGFDDIKDKKVRFKLQPEIHIMRSWDFAYRAARKGNWENYARDRCRFQNRIVNVDPIISTVLSKQHRENIFNERFSKNRQQYLQ